MNHSHIVRRINRRRSIARTRSKLLMLLALLLVGLYVTGASAKAEPKPAQDELITIDEAIKKERDPIVLCMNGHRIGLGDGHFVKCSIHKIRT